MKYYCNINISKHSVTVKSIHYKAILYKHNVVLFAKKYYHPLVIYYNKIRIDCKYCRSLPIYIPYYSDFVILDNRYLPINGEYFLN